MRNFDGIDGMNGMNGMIQLFLVALLLSTLVPRGWADTAVPFADDKKSIFCIALDEHSYRKQLPLGSAKVVLVRDGMTLKQLVDDLGPGYDGPGADGVGIISWYFKNNRVLCVHPIKMNESEVIHLTKGFDSEKTSAWWSN
jgi:hypothetical protein